MDGTGAEPEGGSIAFENVSFSYREDRKILRDVSFCVPAGKTAAIVGVIKPDHPAIHLGLCPHPIAGSAGPILHR